MGSVFRILLRFFAVVTFAFGNVMFQLKHLPSVAVVGSNTGKKVEMGGN